MGEVGSTIQWIDDPAVTALRRAYGTFFFSEYSVIRELVLDSLHNESFGGRVGVGHQVDIPFVFYSKAIGQGVPQDPASSIRYIFGKFDKQCLTLLSR